jgi:hypothetical protein
MSLFSQGRKRGNPADVFARLPAYSFEYAAKRD